MKTREEIQKKVLALIEEMIGLSEAKPETPVADLGMDRLDNVELVIAMALIEPLDEEDRARIIRSLVVFFEIPVKDL